MKHEDFEQGDTVNENELKIGKFYFVYGVGLCVLDKLEYRGDNIYTVFITENGTAVSSSRKSCGGISKATQKETAPQARETAGGMYIEYESIEAKYDHMINRNTD